MISLREVVPNLDAVKIAHVQFVGRRVRSVVSFYDGVFRAIQQADRTPRMKTKTFSEKILAAKGAGLPEYKRLLHALLRRGEKIGTIVGIGIIKHEKYRSFSRKDLPSIIRQLSVLSSLVDQILALDISKDRVAGQQLYAGWRGSLDKISFLLPLIFDYEDWFLNLDTKEIWGPYQFTRALGMSTCPYCNRIFTYTVVHKGGQRIARPQLDHFLPKSKHPLLALSFFNLIPCCAVCNSSVKGSAPVGHDNYLSPYCDNPGHSLISFSYTPLTVAAFQGLSGDLTINVKYDGDPADAGLKRRVENFITIFCLREVYANHTDVVMDIIRKRFEAGARYLETMARTFPHLSVNVDDLYRFAYGTYYDEKEFHRRPLSKLTKDLAIELKIRPTVP